MLRHRLNPNALIRVGLLFLILASLSRWLVHPNARLSEGVVDAGLGFFYGVSIGCMLLGLYLKGQRRSPTG